VHVGVVVTNYPPHLGGVETHVEALAGQLVRSGIGVTVVHLGDGPARWIEVRSEVRVITVPRRLDVGGVLAVPTRRDWAWASGRLVEDRPTHISVHTRYFPMTWLGLRLADARGLPSILTEHGGGHVATASPVIRSGSRAVDVVAGARALRAAGAVLAVSERSAEFVARLSGRNAAVLGNGVDVDFWSGGPAQPPRRHVVFAGRLVAEKGWRAALECLAALPDDTTAVVAGDGPDRAAVTRRLRELCLEDRVRVAGRLDPPALRAELAGALYLNPSTAAEGFQTTLLEAGLAGARIVTHDVGGAAEVVGSGAAPGRVVPSGDIDALVTAARQALDDDSRGEPERLRAYDWTAVAERFVTALQEVAVPRR
jgi:glycosyltransferase involved in cell wall biosynthesis